jgi:hypothetical protein
MKRREKDKIQFYSPSFLSLLRPIIKNFKKVDQSLSSLELKSKYYVQYINYLVMIESIINEISAIDQKNQLKTLLPVLSTIEKEKNINSIIELFNTLENITENPDLVFKSSKHKYEQILIHKMKSIPGGMVRQTLQESINNLRDLTCNIVDDYYNRLDILKALEKLQTAINKITFESNITFYENETQKNENSFQELSKKECDEIQKLFNTIRNLITEKITRPEHRFRVLKYLGKSEIQLNKRYSIWENIKNFFSEFFV